MHDAPPDAPTLKRQGLFPCEGEIARRLSQSEKRWRVVSRLLEREGLPRIDPVMGGRFWPAVVAFFEARYGVRKVSRMPDNDCARNGGRARAGKGIVLIPGPPDGEENWDAR